MLGGVRDLRLGVGAHRGQLGLELLGVGQHAERVAGALQIADQPRGYRAQRRAREADRTVPPTLLCALAAVELAGGGAAAALAKRALRVVPGRLAVPRRAPGALARRRDGALAPRKRALPLDNQPAISAYVPAPLLPEGPSGAPSARLMTFEPPPVS